MLGIKEMLIRVKNLETILSNKLLVNEQTSEAKSRCESQYKEKKELK